MMDQQFNTPLDQIIQKIRENQPLDPLDWQHPDFCKWRNVLEKTCDEFPTQVATQVIAILNAFCTIQLNNSMDYSVKLYISILGKDADSI